MAARFALAGALLGAQLVHASPVAGNATVTPGVHYTTEVVTALTTYCPGATTLTYNDKTYTITQETTLTITDCPCTISKPVKPTYTATPPKDQCATKCYDAYNTCRGKLDSNKAACAAEYAACLGYSPFGPDGSLVTPTACSTQAHPTKPATKPPTYTTEVVTAYTTYCPGPTTLSFNNKTYTVTEPTTLTVTNCPCTITKPHAAPSQPAGDCPKECTNAYNACRSKAGANMATCAAEYASCLGYSPFGPSGSLITPTACSKQPGATTVPSKPTGTGAVPATGTATVPHVTATTPGVVPTGAAGRLAPEHVLLALGALALL
ncbi:hypothetical protein B0T10DRAFT_499423 [Thelonectria olida]|uniref:Cell wall glycoprotein n=1 Tax=Thelonectria olida TaxID=1576542 RepID=A0A9P8VSR0_9HYPO|nr:hypothetical protein B0T10DRAFT_499423 [Thelonectria olida]